MKRIAIATLTFLTLGLTQASYTVKIPLDNKIKYYQWSGTEPVLSEWINDGDIYDCSNWSPPPTSITIGELFIQTATDCRQDQIRNVQNREIDRVSGAIRDSGEPYTESRTTSVSDTRDAIGSLENWAATTPIYTEWVNSGGIYGCSNWTPDPATVTTGQSFDQTATDCKQNQTRSRQEREQETTTLEIRNKGTAIAEIQTITVLSTRSATGTRENWVAATPTYSAWQNQGSEALCNNQDWNPPQHHYCPSVQVTQTRDFCQVIVRTQYKREVETNTGAYRTIGTSQESQIIKSRTETRTVTGTRNC